MSYVPDPPTKHVNIAEPLRPINKRETDLLETICTLVDARPNHTTRRGHFTNRGHMARQIVNLDGTFLVTVECLSTIPPVSE